MRLTDANLYLTGRGLPPQLEIECAGNCSNRFALADGFAWPAKLPGAETPVMIFFCSAACLLAALPPSCCGRA
jgi:hypothetical protein